MPGETSYDRVLYPGFPFPETHPDHLATMASLCGMSPTPATRCRVLELGCGDGGNLIPIAYQCPESTFVGIDLSRRAIESGNQTIAGVELKNIVLQHRDIADFTDDDEKFDYIIAHGVYSWVPQPVRERILDILARHLTPHGVAYLSYNAMPGAYLRDLARSMMLFHVRAVTDDRDRNIQSRKLLQSLAAVSTEDDIYGIVLRGQHARVNEMPDHVLLHDDLDPDSKAFFLYEVVEAAAARGLQYLGDALPAAASPRGLSKDAREMLGQISDTEFVVREQYGDFIRGRAFRNSLFCRHDVPLERTLTSDRIEEFYLSCEAWPAVETVDLSLPEVVEFRMKSGEKLRTDHRLGKAALVALGKAWPRNLSFAELKTEAASLLSQTTGDLQADDVTALKQILIQAFQAGIVQLHQLRRNLTITISEKPVASELARWQAGRGRFLTNLFHSAVVFEDDIARQFLPLLDGTRDITQIAVDLKRLRAEDGSAEPAAPISPEIVREKLSQLAQLGLLVG